MQKNSRRGFDALKRNRWRDWLEAKPNSEFRFGMAAQSAHELRIVRDLIRIKTPLTARIEARFSPVLHLSSNKTIS